MGYSCSAKAATVHKAILDNLAKPDGPSNTWEHKGHTYFDDRGKEQADSAITGTVYKIEHKDGKNYAKRVGGYRIEPDGTITRYPTLSKEKRKEFQEQGLKTYKETHEYLRQAGANV